MRAKRLILVPVLLLALAAPVLAAGDANGDWLVITEARGVVQVKGSGQAWGRVAKGSLQVVDLTPSDKFSPLVNGVPRGRAFSVRGSELNFRIPGGKYKLVIRGEGVSVSMRGDGSVQTDGEPLPGTTAAGTIQIGDGPVREIPDATTRVSFGPGVPTDGGVSPTAPRGTAQP